MLKKYALGSATVLLVMASSLSSVVLADTTAQSQATNTTSAAAVPVTNAPSFKSLKDLKSWANTNNINVIVRDRTGKPIREFHTDGDDVQFTYNADHTLTATDSEGRVKNINMEPQVSSAQSSFNSNMLVSPLTGTSYNGSNYWINGYDMDDLIGNDVFTTNTLMATTSSIQNEFNALGSALKNNVEEYTEQNNGTYTNDGVSYNPASLIMQESNAYGISPAVILTELQKEQGLVFKTSASVSAFAWAMGYGATDNGTLYPNSGFYNQIKGGTSLLKSAYSQSKSYPFNFTVNNGAWASWNGNSYGPTVSIQNAATWSLYNYTPWTAEFNSSGPYGGNYLFEEEFNTISSDFYN